MGNSNKKAAEKGDQRNGRKMGWRDLYLTNPAFENYVKIGFATDLEQRLNSLNSSSSVPYAF